LFSFANTGLAGEPGVGKSSLLKMMENRVGKEYHRVCIGVPLDDADFFLSELLRELLVVVPAVPGVNLAQAAKRLKEGTLSKNAILQVVKTILERSSKPFLVFVDDVEKIRSDRIRHLTRSDRTLQFLEELKALFETRNACFFVSLQEEFHAKLTQVVRDNAEPTVLGLFKNIVLVEKFNAGELREILQRRLQAAGFTRDPESFLEPEGLNLALSLSNGNPRRFLYLVSEGMSRAFLRKAARVEFHDIFEVLNVHLKLDMVCKKLLYFLSKSGRAVAGNRDLQEFMGMDSVSLNRRFETLAKNRLADVVGVVNGSRIYTLPGFGEAETLTPPVAYPAPEGSVGLSQKGERMFILDENK
jgi:hypothetical protein